ncbi:E3 ubiquitin-protein ligase PRT6 [Iris pallida]|uniref:E3 ubiquitin-protein ligase n=1 Tax=Iris pallida TaxID=29817 RepID=A0AAX6G553_IRIPA|nr:E3 ubiquitin-protein ligase PRT6 [Iris pallida]
MVFGCVYEGKQLLITKLVSSILPTEQEVLKFRKLSMKESGGSSGSGKAEELYAESLLWIQWMMFQGDPQDFLKNMAQEFADKRAVCGFVWGRNDLAYRCRTCEHDPTCAICVPCFQNGNHEDHDYSIIYTGGCCDCGDETAWKREGFCSKHKGTNQIKPLPEELANSVGPVLDALLACWMDKLVLVEQQKYAKVGERNAIEVANELSLAVVELLLSFCNCSESLLSFTGRRMLECSGLVNVIVRAERFLGKKVVKKIHELLLKLLGDTIFKYEFAKIFIEYYPITVKELTKESSDSILERYPLLSTFSVQIFTVPTLTPQLVREVNLLGVLLGCLMDLFFSCVAEDGRLQASKWANVYETTIRLVEDMRYVMSHSEVPIYIAHERPDIVRAWLRLLSLVQGMDPVKRATSLHIEEDYDKLYAPFVLGHCLGNIHTLLVGGAYSITSEEMDCSDRQGLFVNNDHSGVGRFPQESTSCSPSTSTRASDCSLQYSGDSGVGRFPQESTSCSPSTSTRASDCSLQYSGVNSDRANSPAFPPFAAWLIIECLKTIESWLGPDSGQRKLESTSSSNSNFWTLRKTLFRIKKNTISTKVRRTAISRTYMNENQVHPPGEGREMLSSSSIHGAVPVLGHDDDPMDVCDMKNRYPVHSSRNSVSDNSLMEVDSDMDNEAFNMLKSAQWPDINYDVKSQEVSFHIPLHRLLSLLLRKALNICYGETGKWDKPNYISEFSSSRQHVFWGQVLKGLHPCGFSAYIMEHPLRLRVFCAQVLAGMWRKNGDAAILSSDGYRSVQWLEQALESDLFLLQCCASLAPAELFVESIQERFGLSSYTSLNLADHNEYESVLVQEMLTLIIQVVKERRFCGLSTSENLRRELVCRLAIGDATHSQLVKALPRDLSKSTQLRDILDVLAAYSKPSGVKQGKYSLRKEFWKELDLYHPRWNSRDLQVAVERYSNVCKVSALNIQLPRWTAVFDPLSSISRIATSKTVLQITRAVIFYAVFTKMPSISRASEGVLVTALHLLSLGLDICQSQLSCDGKFGVDLSGQADDSFPLLMYASEEFDGGVADEMFWKNQSLLSLLVSLLRKYREDNDYSNAETGQFSIISLAENILKKFADLSPNCMNILKRLAPDLVCRTLHHFPEPAMQSSAFTSDMEKRKAKARKHQADIMNKMRAEQAKFLLSLKSEANDEIDSTESNTEPSILEVDHVDEESAPVCSLCRGPDTESPLCFFVLLQVNTVHTI